MAPLITPQGRAHLKPGETLVVLGASAAWDSRRWNWASRWRARDRGRLDAGESGIRQGHGAADGFVYPPVPLSKDQQKTLSEDISG